MITGYGNLLERGSRLKKLLAASATALALSAALAMPANADLASVGPVNPDNNFPAYFQDGDDLRLEICETGPNCVAAAQFGAPAGEAFWYLATADIDTPDGGVTLELATEAAYAAPGDGQEIAFNRLRLVGKTIEPGTYRAITPYGTFEVQADARNGIKFTDDQGCMGVAAPCAPDFPGATTGFLGPNYLTWDTYGLTEAQGGPPAGFIGDGSTPHAVTGSVIDADGDDANGVQPQNFFKLEQINANDDVVRDMGTTDQFVVQGKVHGPSAFVNVKGGTYNQDQTVRLSPSVPGTRIVYTLDGTTPAVDANGVVTNGTEYDPNSTIDIKTAADTTTTTALKYIAVDTSNVASQVRTQTYTIDKQAPANATASPDGGIYNASQAVTLDAEDGATLRYRIGTNPADPTATTGTVYNGQQIQVTSDQTIKAIVIDAAGNTSGVASFAYTIDRVAPGLPSANLETGFYDAAQQISFASDAPDLKEIRYTTNGDVPDASSGTVYNEQPINVSSTTTFKAVAVDRAGNASQVLERTISIRQGSSVGLNVAAKDLKLGKSRAISGAVDPAHAGQTVKMTIDRPGTLANQTKTLTLDGASHYAFAYTPKATGRYSVSVAFAADNDHLGSVSETKGFKVVR